MIKLAIEVTHIRTREDGGGTRSSSTMTSRMEFDDTSILEVSGRLENVIRERVAKLEKDNKF